MRQNAKKKNEKERKLARRRQQVRLKKVIKRE